MRRIRTLVAIWVCKTARFGLRLLRRGGTNFPGKLALRVYPPLLGVLGGQVHTLIITGTNGKTTSARMLEQCYKNANLPAFSNRSGANLLAGITAEFVANAGIWGKMKTRHAIIECDEAAFRQVSRYVDAKVVLVTNVFRDQLDRYGEMSHTVNSIREGLEHSPNAAICLNADCTLSVSMARGLENPVTYFGVETVLYQDGGGGALDATRCIECSHEYEYAYKTYGHLGAYHCPACGYSRPEASVAVTRVLEESPDETTVEVRTKAGLQTVEINLPGAFNIYNAVGVMAAGEAMGFAMPLIAGALAKFQGGFGRMERLEIGKVPVRLILVKNPIGASQALRYFEKGEGPMALVICLNDRPADGTDISWLWDVDAQVLGEMGDRLTAVYSSGTRCDDLAIWLKYAGVDVDKITVEPDYDKLLQLIEKSPVPVTVMPTYTAMLALREKLVKQYGLEQFWE